MSSTDGEIGKQIGIVLPHKVNPDSKSENSDLLSIVLLLLLIPKESSVCTVSHPERRERSLSEPLSESLLSLLV